MERITLSIHFKDGQCTVQGPIQDKLLCYGLLEMAKECIKNYNDQQGQNKIVIPDFIPPGTMKPGN